VGHRDDLELHVQQLLDELRIKLGFCLPPNEQRRFREAPTAKIDDFTDAVFEAQGMGDVHSTTPPSGAGVVDQHMSRRAETERKSSG
jgi:hypothetical protein